MWGHLQYDHRPNFEISGKLQIKIWIFNYISEILICLSFFFTVLNWIYYVKLGGGVSQEWSSDYLFYTRNHHSFHPLEWMPYVVREREWFTNLTHLASSTPLLVIWTLVSGVYTEVYLFERLIPFLFFEDPSAQNVILLKKLFVLEKYGTDLWFEYYFEFFSNAIHQAHFKLFKWLDSLGDEDTSPLMDVAREIVREVGMIMLPWVFYPVQLAAQPLFFLFAPNVWGANSLLQWLFDDVGFDVVQELIGPDSDRVMPTIWEYPEGHIMNRVLFWKGKFNPYWGYVDFWFGFNNDIWIRHPVEVEYEFGRPFLFNLFRVDLDPQALSDSRITAPMKKYSHFRYAMTRRYGLTKIWVLFNDDFYYSEFRKNLFSKSAFERPFLRGFIRDYETDGGEGVIDHYENIGFEKGFHLLTEVDVDLWWLDESLFKDTLKGDWFRNEVLGSDVYTKNVTIVDELAYKATAIRHKKHYSAALGEYKHHQYAPRRLILKMNIERGRKLLRTYPGLWFKGHTRWLYTREFLVANCMAAGGVFFLYRRFFSDFWLRQEVEYDYYGLLIDHVEDLDGRIWDGNSDYWLNLTHVFSDQRLYYERIWNFFWSWALLTAGSHVSLRYDNYFGILYSLSYLLNIWDLYDYISPADRFKYDCGWVIPMSQSMAFWCLYIGLILFIWLVVRCFIELLKQIKKIK